jgi:hypothetical protein
MFGLSLLGKSFLFSGGLRKFVFKFWLLVSVSAFGLRFRSLWLVII